MKVILLYVVLVGLPIIGVAGVLQLGHDLKPPISVSGTWELQFNPQFSHGSECQSREPGFDRLLLNISQSGRQLVIAFNKADRVLVTELAGDIEGQRITAEAIESPLAPAIQAKVERQSEADRLVGVLRLACCRPEAGASFTALRHQRSRKGPGVH